MKHYLVDIIDAHEEFHAGRFVSLADEAIHTVSAEGRLSLDRGRGPDSTFGLFSTASPLPLTFLKPFETNWKKIA